MESLAIWLKSTPVSWYVNNKPWVWPAAETLHFIGMALLIGCVGILDLRMLGVGKGIPVRPLHRLIPYGIAGFVINLITGALFFIGVPDQYMHNVAFAVKLSLIIIGGLNVLFFYGTVYRATEDLGPEDDAPFKAKVAAAVSLVAWFGVMYFGRMLPFIGNAF